MELYIWTMMRERNIKPKQLAELMGISVRKLYYIYEGKRSPTLAELTMMAIIFDVGIEDLYDSPYKQKREK